MPFGILQEVVIQFDPWRSAVLEMLKPLPVFYADGHVSFTPAGLNSLTPWHRSQCRTQFSPTGTRIEIWWCNVQKTIVPQCRHRTSGVPLGTKNRSSPMGTAYSLGASRVWMALRTKLHGPRAFRRWLCTRDFLYMRPLSFLNSDPIISDLRRWRLPNVDDG